TRFSRDWSSDVCSSDLSRSMLGTVLADGSYEVVGTTHTSALGYALAMKHRPHVICIAREQVEDGNNVVEQLRADLPKTLVFLVRSEERRVGKACRWRAR